MTVDNLLKLKDLTEKLIQREAQIAELTQKLDLVLNLTGIGIWVWNMITNDLSWNPNMYYLFDRDESEAPLNYSHFISRVHPGDQERINKALEEAKNSAIKYDVVYRVVDRKGELKLIAAQGKIVDHTMYGVCLDITQGTALKNWR
jgi:PAS domain-containing protein